MKFTWIGQSGFIAETPCERVVVDPYLSDVVRERQGHARLLPPPTRLEDTHPDYLLISHDHMDHYDPVALPRMMARYKACELVGPQSVLDHARRDGIADARLRLLRAGDAIQLPGLRVTATPTRHSDPLGVGFIFEHGGYLAYMSGDTEYYPELAAEVQKLLPRAPDIAFVVINGRLGNMNFEEAARFMAELGPRLAVPMHFGMFAANTADPAEFARACAPLGIATKTPEPGQPIFLDCDLPPAKTAAAPAGPVRVTVDAARPLGPVHRWELYQNSSIRHAPPPALGARVAEVYGRPRIARCWLCLDDLWDYRTDEFRFNYRVGEDFYAGDTVKHPYDRDRVSETQIRYEDYLRGFAEHADEVLLNVRRYEHEVINGVITLETWRRVLKTGLAHYKKLFPNIRYLEVLNEWELPHFGGLADETVYHRFYRTVCEVANELNAELRPALPLLVGGPGILGGVLSPDAAEVAERKSWNKSLRLRRFFETYAADASPGKRLDFVSFHEYSIGGNPGLLARYEEWVRGWLARAGLPDDLPIFVTEIGVGHPKKDPTYNLAQAAGMTAFQHQTRLARTLRLFPWVLYHAPLQVSLVQFDDALNLTPFGMATALHTKMTGDELATTSDGLLANGRGVGALAAVDARARRLTVKLWNYAETPAEIEVSVQRPPTWAQRADLPARLFRVDAKHNNVFTDPAAGRAPSASEAPDLVNDGDRFVWRVALPPQGLALLCVG